MGIRSERRDEARIDSKAVAANQTLSEAALHDRLELAPQDVTVPEAAVAIAREGRVIRHLAVQTEPKEPRRD
jgi:hypothetical protein